MFASLNRLCSSDRRLADGAIQALGAEAQKRALIGGVRTLRFKILNPKAKKIRKTRPSIAEIVENVVGCKWTIAVLARVREDVNRPGALERAIPGISAKVLNERLRKLVDYGVLRKVSYPEIPPRVEYILTDLGRRFVPILDQIEALECELAGDTHPASSGGQAA